MSEVILEKSSERIPRRAYDRNNLHPLDQEARKYDDTSEGIDWDEILEETEDDYLAGRCAFNSADYPDWETAMKALDEWSQSILEEVLSRERPSAIRDDSACQAGVR